MDPFVTTPDEMVALMSSETTMYTQIITTANIKLEK